VVRPKATAAQKSLDAQNNKHALLGARYRHEIHMLVCVVYKKIKMLVLYDLNTIE